VTALCPVTPGCCIVSPCATTRARSVEGVSDPQPTLNSTLCLLRATLALLPYGVVMP